MLHPSPGHVIIYGFHGWNLYPSLVTCQSTGLQSYDYYNEVHNPLSRLLEEQHMYQTCLCSTILWPLLQLRQPSHTWMKIKENWAASNVFFFFLLAVPTSSSGWCLNPVSFLLSNGLGKFITYRLNVSLRLNTAVLFSRDDLKVTSSRTDVRSILTTNTQDWINCPNVADKEINFWTHKH